MEKKGTYQSDLRIYVILVGILILISIIFIYSASAVYALEIYGNHFYFLKRHCMGLIIGLMGLYCATRIPLQLVQRTSVYFFCTSCMLTAMTLFSPFGRKIHGSSRWLPTIFGTFQPSELIKIGTIIYVAYLLANHQKKPLSVWYYIKIIGAIGVPAFILLQQPDFGMTVTLVTTTLILFFIADFNIRNLSYAALAAAVSAIGLIWMQPYRIKRITTFLDPWQDPQGAGFQIIQSLIAIGSGGLYGLGVGYSRQKFFYLPMQHTDFIFSIIAEETGFIGTCLIICIYIAMLYKGIKIGLNQNSVFGMFIIIGFAAMTSIQAGINIAVATSLAPTKGFGLPFISYGNSALVCNLFMVGLIIRISNEALKKKKKF